MFKRLALAFALGSSLFVAMSPADANACHRRCGWRARCCNRGCYSTCNTGYGYGGACCNTGCYGTASYGGYYTRVPAVSGPVVVSYPVAPSGFLVTGR